MQPKTSPREVMRKKLSLFSEGASSHGQELQTAAAKFGLSCTIRSMCAFTSSGKSGNQVAVVIDGNNEFDSKRMGRIAERCVESMVAFIQPAQGNNRLRYYCTLNLLSPNGGCSRSMTQSMAIAAISVLLEIHRPASLPPLTEGQTILLKVVSPAGQPWQDEVSVRVETDGSIWVKVPAARILGTVPVEDVCEALNLNQLALQTEFPVQVVQCVARHIIIPVRSRRSMSGLDPYMDLISSVCTQYQADSFHLFSLDPMAGGAVHTRNLAPRVMLEEEAASASANAALAAYVHYHRVLPVESQEVFGCEQGFAFSMKARPSRVMVLLSLQGDDAKKQESVTVTGQMQGVAAQNEWLGQAVGSEATRDRLMATGDRYASNHYDESRFNLPEGYYEKVQQKELEERIKMGEAKRAGKVYKREEEEHVSTAILPPSLAQPAPVTGCWVGGTCVPCTRPDRKSVV